MDDKYRYKLRPGYGSEKLLLEFDAVETPEYFLLELVNMLSLCGFEQMGTIDLWMNDEILIGMRSTNGTITLSLNIWGMIFIVGNHNQQDILRIDELLALSQAFEKQEVDFSAYRIS
ncbi:hypothetical protein FK220_016095 [Flavobacteriaceae bacterium TP-CH-4]|uniref:Uncharacterized protein n=1 Tax=Pelagihabitans pacificus TaxID=2696054 RepID=A0A967AUZ4_9FLAO|nr:hypothetical protein [Pelagihabitans pacificus]NHF60876.1 hypothetical protein [Pelagihabitans pacificus]